MLFDFWGIWLDFPFNALYMILCTCTIISWYDVAGNPLQNSICRLSCHSWGDVSCNSKQYDAYAQFGQVAHIQKTHILYKVGLHSVEKYSDKVVDNDVNFQEFSCFCLFLLFMYLLDKVHFRKVTTSNIFLYCDVLILKDTLGKHHRTMKFRLI